MLLLSLILLFYTFNITSDLFTVYPFSTVLSFLYLHASILDNLPLTLRTLFIVYLVWICQWWIRTSFCLSENVYILPSFFAWYKFRGWQFLLLFCNTLKIWFFGLQISISSAKSSVSCSFEGNVCFFLWLILRLSLVFNNFPFFFPSLLFSSFSPPSPSFCFVLFLSCLGPQWFLNLWLDSFCHFGKIPGHRLF